MKLEDIIELKKRIDFNLTEAETLQRLVIDASKKGEGVRVRNNSLRKQSEAIKTKMEEYGLLLYGKELEGIMSKSVAAGVDGSLQKIGGTGGHWYVPFSIAQVVFEGGPTGKATLRIYSAGIEEVREQEIGNMSVDTVAALKMMVGESKAISNWGSKNLDSVLFIDGPIVDPPGFKGLDYIAERCRDLSMCMPHCTMIGCVKRSRDLFFKSYLKDEGIIESSKLEDYPSDQHLILYIFSRCREEGVEGPIFTNWIDLSNKEVYKHYSEQGIFIASAFVQKNIATRILRVDIVLSELPAKNPKFTSSQIKHAIRNVVDWTFPGQDLPIPIQLAHEKCKIREGCAEILYDEIMARGKVADKFGQIISVQLR